MNMDVKEYTINIIRQFLALLRSLIGRKSNEKYPAYKGVTYGTDKIGDFAMIDKAAFFKEYGKLKQRVVAQIPDGSPLMPVKIDGVWSNQAMFAPWQFVLYGQQCNAGSIVSLADLWPETRMTNEELYLRIVGNKYPVRECYMLLGEDAKNEMLKDLKTAEQKAIAWEELWKCDTPDDVVAALKAFCKITGYVP